MKKRECFKKMIFCLSFFLFCVVGMNAQTSTVYNSFDEVQVRISEIIDELPTAPVAQADVLQKELGMLTNAVQTQDLTATVAPTYQERIDARIAKLQALMISNPRHAAIYQRKLDRIQ